MEAKNFNVSDCMVYGPLYNGKWYVRPVHWAGIWDRQGVLQRGCNVQAELDSEEECLSYIKDKCKKPYISRVFRPLYIEV